MRSGLPGQRDLPVVPQGLGNTEGPLPKGRDPSFLSNPGSFPGFGHKRSIVLNSFKKRENNNHFTKGWPGLRLIISSWLLRTLWIAGIISFLVISAIPIGETPLSDIKAGDKLAHYGVFFLLAFFPAGTGAVSKRIAVVVLFFVAIGSELMQVFLVYRSGEILDIAADLLGLFTGLALGSMSSRIFSSPEQKTDLHNTNHAFRSSR